MTPVRTYLEAYRESLLADYERASKTSVHGGDLGENYEDLVVGFLENVMPRRLSSARGGQVIGVGQKPSSQIDVLVTHDSAPEFRADAKSYRIVEGVVMAVAVKSRLTTAALKEDFLGLATLPALSGEAIATAAVPHDQFLSGYKARFPKRIIWGWTGATVQTLQEALVDVATGVEAAQRPDLVVVLDRGIAIGRNGDRWPAWRPEDGPATGFAEILNMGAAAAGWASQFNVKISPYWE